MLLKTIQTNSDFPIKVESHPAGYNGYPFITLVRFNDEPNLTIIDNVHKKHLDAYCLDLCAPAKVNERVILKVANYWYHTSRDLYPISIEFSKRGLSEDASKIMKSYSIEFITRVIGPVPFFEMGTPSKIRKRKRKIPKDYEVVITSEYFRSLLSGSDYV